MNFEDDDEVVTLTLHNGDCVEYMKTLATGSVRWVITDPPYGIAFMSKKWDNPDKMTSESEEGDEDSPGGEEEEAAEKLEAGPAFEVWNKGWLSEAFRILKPGGTIVSFGATRMFHRLLNAAEDVGFENPHIACWTFASGFPKSLNIMKNLQKLGNEEAAKTFEGYGTALKPAVEVIVVAYKPA